VSAGDDDNGLRFSLSFCCRASSSACFRRFLEDFGRDRSVARLVDDLVFFGLDSFALDILSVSFPARALKEIELNVFLCSDFDPSSIVFGRFRSLDFLGDDGGGWLC
jgi:hypothetical protein